jgi:Fe-S cluster assembly iron-binding protein IscA
MFQVTEKAMEMIDEFIKNRNEAVQAIRVIMSEGG